MKITAALIALLAVSAFSFQVGESFPSLKGETMNDKTITLPSDCKGKFTIVCMAYSEDAENDLKTWFTPAYEKFIAKTGLMDDAFDVNLYFVPMFTGVKAAAAGAAKKQIVKDTDPTLHPHVLLYKGDLDAYKKSLKMDDKKKPYIFLLDKTGKIIYATSGAFSEEKMDAIDDKITD
ncbi:MAG: hypothetical protein FD123_2213 [Bacteroidetes bacterium]|nr:MAG: hypothetical protein FD123_2213 [Bacteroidota bacterium]